MNRGFGRPFNPPRFTQQPVYDDDVYDDHNDDEIMNSSPCPPERRSYSQYPIPQQAQYYDDPIDEYMEGSYFEGEQFSEPPYSHDPAQQQAEYAPVEDTYETNYYDAYTQEPSSQSAYPPPEQHQMMSQMRRQDSQQYDQYQHDAVPVQVTAQLPTPPIQREVLAESRGIRLRPVSDLPDMFRTLFKFGVFNAVQSTCFDTIMSSNENLVASAPTGSGKTVLFELAIIHMLTRTNSTAQNTMKCVYMAPTKALCSEKCRDWTSKFSPLGIKCCELTGDTVQFGRSVWGDAKNSTIIVTTAEKWDSLTRNWEDHGKILSSIILFLVDEVHILNESRGSTLEVVISRMKLRGSSVRFLLVSATAPNIQDIAAWIGSSKKSIEYAKVFEFSEDFRPCKLKKIVVAIPRQRGNNDFQFAKSLDYKLFSTLQTYSVGKPILIFCSTRKGVFTTAEQLMKDFQDAEKKKQSLPWTRSARVEHAFPDRRVVEFASYGIGVHHAGMTLDDRRAIEDLFLKKTLRVLVATSTLAVGVNLPAHTVVIKGVHTFQNSASVEYSDLDIMQMLGRAGRPQFDNEGTAIIMCEGELEAKYRALVQGNTILESSLHVNLSEHLNSEIGLGTVSSMKSATEWLRSSFLFQRIRKNPRHYALGKEEDQTWEERVDDLVIQSIEKLKTSELITCDGDEPEARLKSTEYGDIMSKFYIRQATMSAILALPEKPTLRDILEMIASADELTDSKIRASEKTYLNLLKKHNDIRFGLKKVDGTADKVFLLIQAVLGGISLNSPEYRTGDSQPHLDAFRIFKHIPRIARAVVEVAICRQRGAQLKHGFEALRCLTAKAWEDRPVVLRQIDTIGEKSLKVLAENGITSIDILRAQDPINLETLLNRRPPFGLEMIAAVKELPFYSLRVTQTDVRTSKGQKPVEIDLTVECSIIDDRSPALKAKKAKGRYRDMTAIITMTSDMDLIDFRRTATKSLLEKKSFELTAVLEKPSQAINVYISSESLAGLTVTKAYKPDVPSSEYPTRNTRPPTSMKADVEEFEEDPNFWANMAIDDNDLDKKPVAVDQVGTNQESQASQTKLKATTSTKVTSEKLPNGNYRCNHPCKDKQKCRHLCCREGLPKPPKKSTEDSQQPQISKQLVRTNNTEAATPKKKAVTRDHTIERLEALHKSTNVLDNLKLANGQRLKLDAKPDLKRRRKESRQIDTNISFAELKDTEEQPMSPSRAMADDDDDLPEPHEIMKTTKPGSAKRSSDDLFDSEMDDIFRDLPEDHEDPFVRPSSPAFSREERNSFQSPPAKRVKLTEEIHESSNLFIKSTSDTDNDVIVIEDEEDEDVVPEPPPNDYYMEEEEEDDFVLDPSCIDIIPSTPELVHSTTHESDEDQSFAEASPAILMPTIGGSKVVEDTDDFAEFEAWLNSGAVEIIP